MSEVSGRAWAFFVQAERHGLVDLAELLRDAPVERRALEERRARIRWDDWAELLARFAAPLTRAQVIASGRLALTEDFLGGLLRIVGVFTNAQDVYRLGAQWTGPSMYRSMAFTYAAPDPDTVHVSIALRARFRPSEPWFLGMVGVFESVPELFGQPPAQVRWTVTPTSGDYRITLPARPRARERLRRVVDAFRAPHTVTEALVEQQRQVSVQLEALRDAESGYASLLDTLPTAVALFDDARVVYGNPALARALGLAPHELEGERLAKLVHADDLAALLGAAASAPITCRMVRKDGGLVHLEGVMLEHVRFYGRTLRGLCANDVTARVEVEGRLARSEEMRSAMVEVMPDLLLRVQRDGRIVDELGGRELPAAVRAQLAPGASLAALPLGRPSDVAAIVAALALGQPHTFEWLLDSGATLEGRLVPLALEHDALVFVRDVSRRRDEQRQLAIAERMAAVGTLAAGVAHEINNPLAAVIGNLELLTEAIEAGEALAEVDEVQAMVRDATEGARRVMRIVASMKAFSGGRSAAVAATVAPIDVEAVVDSALVLITQQIVQRARLVREAGRPPRALAGADRLTQVMVNLLVNAVQATPEGDPDAHEIRIRTAFEDGWVVLEVHDTGVGIAPAALPRIFDPFFTTKPIGEGTGLGLAISHRIVREAGGTLTATSQVGRGTVLRVALRPATAELAEVAVPAAPVPVAARRARIVIVDDEPAVGRTLVRALGDHDVEIVATAALALARLAQPPWPDLILCDLMLPGLTGAELYQRVCQVAPALADRFLFTTGGAFTPTTEEFVRTHAARVHVKPLDLARLRAAIALAIARDA